MNDKKKRTTAALPALAGFLMLTANTAGLAKSIDLPDIRNLNPEPEAHYTRHRQGDPTIEEMPDLFGLQTGFSHIPVWPATVKDFESGTQYRADNGYLTPAEAVPASRDLSFKGSPKAESNLNLPFAGIPSGDNSAAQPANGESKPSASRIGTKMAALFDNDFTAAPVPSPVMLLGLGLVGLSAIARRKPRPHLQAPMSRFPTVG